MLEECQMYQNVIDSHAVTATQAVEMLIKLISLNTGVLVC